MRDLSRGLLNRAVKEMQDILIHDDHQTNEIDVEKIQRALKRLLQLIKNSN